MAVSLFHLRRRNWF